MAALNTEHMGWCMEVLCGCIARARACVKCGRVIVKLSLRMLAGAVSASYGLQRLGWHFTVELCVDGRVSRITAAWQRPIL